MAFIGILTVFSSFVSVVLVVLAFFLFKKYLSWKNEMLVVRAVNSDRGAKGEKVLKAFELMGKGKIPLERIVKKIRKESVLRDLKRAVSKNEMIAVIYRAVGFDLPQGFVLSKTKAKFDEDEIRDEVNERLKKSRRGTAESIDFSSVKEPADLISFLDKYEVLLVNRVLEDYGNAGNSIREKLIKNEKIRAIISRSRTKKEVVENAKQVVAGEYLARYKELKTDVSNSRKKGNDVNMTDLKLMSAKPWIKMFELTGDKSYLEKVEAAFEEVESELKKIDEEAKNEIERKKGEEYASLK